MPYIEQERREQIESGQVPPQDLTPGDLNFLITNAILMWLAYHPKNYESLNAVMGALESAKIEFYRRVVTPYEVAKAAQNGDIYQQFFDMMKPRIEVPEIEIAK